MSVVLSAPLSQQLQPKFIGFRTLFEARERPSRMYSWPTMVFASAVVEIPWNIFAFVIAPPGVRFADRFLHSQRNRFLLQIGRASCRERVS